MELHPARKTGESFEDYKKRRAAENAMVKEHLKGRRIEHSPVSGKEFHAQPK